MCGIACILEVHGDPRELRERAVAMARLLRHRGPDWSGVFADDNAVLAHERLSIVDVEHGAQPLTNAGGDLVLAVNGEIYNHRALRAEFADYPFKTSSDC
jgi:asparagine synthase (glutamine-hydrolysing)